MHRGVICAPRCSGTGFNVSAAHRRHVRWADAARASDSSFVLAPAGRLSSWRQSVSRARANGPRTGGGRRDGAVPVIVVFGLVKGGFTAGSVAGGPAVVLEMRRTRKRATFVRSGGFRIAGGQIISGSKIARPGVGRSRPIPGGTDRSLPASWNSSGSGSVRARRFFPSLTWLERPPAGWTLSLVPRLSPGACRRRFFSS